MFRPQSKQRKFRVTVVKLLMEEITKPYPEVEILFRLVSWTKYRDNIPKTLECTFVVDGSYIHK